jgi:hypothetical protein
MTPHNLQNYQSLSLEEFPTPVRCILHNTSFEKYRREAQREDGMNEKSVVNLS